MEGIPPRVGPDVYDVEICPGWLVRQPAVEDGSWACSALEKGALELFDPDGLNVVWEMALIAQRAMNLYQAERQKILSDRLKNQNQPLP